MTRSTKKLLPFALCLALWAVPALSTAQTQIAVLPVNSRAGIDADSAYDLLETLRSAANRSGATLLGHPTTLKVLGKQAGRCDETCVGQFGLQTKVDKVVVCTIAQEGYVLRATLALVNGPTGAIDRTEIVDGKSAASMRPAISNAADRLLTGPAASPTNSSGAEAQTGTWTLSSPPLEPPPFSPFKAVAVGPEGGEKIGYKTGPLTADVFINGRLVGQTPFEDGLPPGEYKIEVISGKQVAAWSKTLADGKPYRVRAIINIPVDAP